jgi:uncharacterized membrane protein SirB2
VPDFLDYATLRAVHVGAVYLSGTLFLLRGFGMLAGQSWYLRGAWRVLPHALDSLLLAAAVGLLIVLSGHPLREPWLITKLVALVVYIGLGSYALKRGRTYAQRTGCFAAALAVFLYIIGVAMSRSPLLGVVA